MQLVAIDKTLVEFEHNFSENNGDIGDCAFFGKSHNGLDYD